MEANNIEVLDLNQQAVILTNNGNVEKAIELYNKAITIDPAYIDTYINLGNLYASNDQIDLAIESYNDAKKIDKHYGQLFFHLGNMYSIKENFDQGIENYNFAIAEGFDEAILYYNMGIVFEEKEDIDSALRNYSKAIFKDPNIPEVRLRKGLLQMNLGKLEEALDTFSELIKFTPDAYEGYHYKFQVLSQMEKYEEAEELLDAALALFPKDVSIFYDKIQLQTLRGNLQKALEMISQAETMEGYEIEIRNLTLEKGKIYAMQEKIPEAIKCFEKCKEFETEDTFDFETRFYLINIYYAEEQYENMLINADQLLSRSDANLFVKAAFYYKPLALKKLNRTEEAKKYYKEAISIYRLDSIHNATNLDTYIYRALCHKDLGEYEKSMELVDFILNIKYDISEVHLIKSELYKSMGLKEKSEEELNIAKQIKPSLNGLIM